MYKQSGVDADDFGNERYGYLTEGAKKQIAEATGTESVNSIKIIDIGIASIAIC